MYNIEKYTPKCNKRQGSIDIHRGNSMVSVTWLDLPEEDVEIYDNGCKIYGLPCGIYHCSIYDINTQETELLEVDLSCQDPLSIDLINYKDDMCTNQKFEVCVEWSGGLPPYSVSLGNSHVKTNKTKLFFDILPNTKYYLKIKDSNKCYVSKQDIEIKYKPMIVSVEHDRLVEYQHKAKVVKAHVKGGIKPYSYAWYRASDTENPILVNVDSVPNTLPEGEYMCVVTDVTGCASSALFTIKSKQPILIEASVTADYKSDFQSEKHSCETVHNLILLDLSKNIEWSPSSKISITHNDQESEHFLVMDYGELTINNNKYMYFYINPGINSLKNNVYLSIDNGEKITLESKFTLKKTHKILSGSFILNSDYSYTFAKNDQITASNSNKELVLTIKNIYTLTGYYIDTSIRSIINPNLENNDCANILNFLNNNDTHDLYISSIKNYKNLNYGKITGYISGGSYKNIEVSLLDSNRSSIITDVIIKSDRFFEIRDIKHGQYYLLIKDNNEYASFYNNQQIANPEYGAFIQIFGSIEEEKNNMIQQAAYRYGLDPSIFHRSDKPGLQLIMPPKNKNGVLVNVSPKDAKYTIYNDNFSYTGYGYGYTEEIDPGKYSMVLEKEGYATENIDIVIVGKQDIISVIMDKI